MATDEARARTDCTEASDLRVFWNRLLFRGFLFGAGATAIALDAILRSERLTWAYASQQARLMSGALGVRVTVRGAEKLPEGSRILVPNHQSHFDIAAILGFLPGRNRFAAKKELFREPVLGRVLRTMRMIPIDREKPAEAIERLNEKTNGDSSVVIFPEGTRNMGDGLLPFKKGAFVAAIELGAPIVPIAIRGAAKVMPPRGYLSIYPGDVEIEVLDPIRTDGMTYGDRDDLMDLVRGRLQEALGEEFQKGANRNH